MIHKKKLAPNRLKELNAIVETKTESTLKHPMVTIIMVLGGVYLMIYAATYFMTAIAAFVKACKTFQQEWNA